MKGLLIKDFKLLKMQKMFFVVVIAVAIIMALSSNDMSFIMGYLMFVMPLFAMSTISYDEFDKGYAFIFTLPISRKGYVIEKYLFGVILGVVSFVLSALLTLIFGAVTNNYAWEAITAAPITFAIMMLIMSLMLPLQIKFGAEKGRIATLAAAGCALVIGFLGTKLLELSGIDIFTVLENLSRIDLGIAAAAALAASALVCMASVSVSIAIMKKKEF